MLTSNISQKILGDTWIQFVLISETYYFTWYVNTQRPLEMLSMLLGLKVNVCEHQWHATIHYLIIDLWEGKRRH